MDQQIQMKSPFVQQFNMVAETVHDMAREKGFWDKDRNDGEMLMLAVTELAEGLEGLRHGNPPSDHIPKFTAIEEELADCVIRLMDFAAGRRIRLAEAIEEKIQFNAGRERLHGKTF